MLVYQDSTHAKYDLWTVKTVNRIAASGIA